LVYSVAMPRQPRLDIAGEIYHVINRANARMQIFNRPGDYKAVINTLLEIKTKIPLQIYSFCIMPNHWHFAVKPNQDGDMGRFFGKFTQAVTQRWHAYHHTAGSGHLFQGRFKSFLVENDAYFLQLMKYIEANPLRAKLVERAEQWQWGSLNIRNINSSLASSLLDSWPLDMPTGYLVQVNQPLPKAVHERITHSIVKSTPLGGDEWVLRKVKEFQLEYTIRNPGRQSKS